MIIVEAIQRLRPNGEFVLLGDTYEGLDWRDKVQNKPTKEEVEQMMVVVQEEKDANAYKELRAIEYPPLEDLADALYWQSENDNGPMEEYLNKVKAVKEKYPKGEKP